MTTFSGVIVPMVTPFNRDERQTINYEVAEQLINRLVSAGASGIFVFGSNGEFHLVGHKEKVDFSRHVIEYVRGRVPVYVGTGSCSTYEACELSREAEALGASALSVINPYFMGITSREIESYYEDVSVSVKIPIILYNIPKSTGMNLPAGIVAKLAPIDNIRGIKDSSGDMDNLASYVRAAKGHDMDVLVGSDGKISEAYELGASGTIAGTANLICDVVVALWSALERGDTTAVTRLQADIEPLRDVLHLGSTPSMLKRSLELAGVPVGPARRPVGEVPAGLDDSIGVMLDHYGIAHA